MAAPTNFLRWNPNANNQNTDAEYLSDTERLNGATDGIFPSKLANKLFYQSAIMIAAIAEMMVNKDYEIQDSDYEALITSLSHIVTDESDKLLESGTKAWFYQNTAPAGWTVKADVSNCLLAVRGGTAAYKVWGGVTAGTWVQPSHTHETGEHILTAAECAIRSHSHLSPTTNGVEDPSYRYELASSLGNKSNGYDFGYAAAPTQATEQTYADVGHDHGATGSGSTTASWRPYAAVGIICEKD